MRKTLLLSVTLLLNGCFSSIEKHNDLVSSPDNWKNNTIENIAPAKQSDFKAWWTHFNDPALNLLVEQALKDSPDRLIAESRIAEARGLRRTAKSSLFPQIGISGSIGREDQDLSTASYPDQFYDAGFDASYEIDLFGRNRKNLNAADEQLLAAEEQYHDISLSLIAEITRTYIDYRAAQNQSRIAEKNLISQKETFKLVSDLYRLGSAPKLDVERTGTLVNTTRASIPEFARQAENARLRLSVLVGVLPEKLPSALEETASIPEANIQPVLAPPSQILAQRPDIKAAAHLLASNTALTEAAIADIFPAFSLRGFYGIAENALTGTTTPWNIALGAAVSLLDFGRIQGRIDAAESREKQAYELYRKTVLEAVSEVESALNDYAHINEQRISLKQAYDSAHKALELSQTLYKEGEIAFLDVLDSQRTVNNAEAALVSAESAQSESLARLYKSLGIY